MTKKSGTGAYFTTSHIGFSSGTGVFRDVKLPGGKTVHVMNERVFRDALGKAGRKLRVSANGPKSKGMND